ncbi:MAG: hypothetical protein HOP37_10525 [Cyclobacteriaceae bacterium]|nr:hypothetical protein [Cyclobacteriaceae bacterium]
MNARILFFLLLCAGQIGLAQSDSTKQKKQLGFYSHAGVIHGDFAKLNSTLSNLGYPALRDFYGGVTYGITKQGIKNNSYGHLALSFMQSTPGVLDVARTKDVRLRNWELQLGGNFDLVKHPKWLIYPFLTEGFGYSELTLYDNIVRQSFASSVATLASPDSKTWSTWYLFLNGGMGIERKFRVWVYDFYVGASGGYRLNLLSRYKTDYPTNDNAPLGLSGFEWNIRIRFEIWDTKRLERMGKRQPKE